ncbi:MAG TPA: Gfo/Idh/MocA family oxidoreductase [Thermomicrobiales bacterium]|nr:Gfo/Idh/MocA family oxidoreductase [Thermomicrobiales bacterium]
MITNGSPAGTSRPATSDILRSRPIRLAIFGDAENARRLRDLPDVDIRWLVKRDRADGSIAGALADRDVDAVLIDLPIAPWYDIAVDAARAGKHLFLAAPLAITVDDARALVDVCADAGVSIVIDNTVRFTPEYRKIAQIIAAGELGQIATIRTNRVIAPPETGDIIDHALRHDLDALRNIFGDIRRLHAHAAMSRLGRPRQEFAAASIRFANGAIAHIEGRLSPTTPRVAIEIAGQNGILSFDSDAASTLTIERTTATPLRTLARPAVATPEQISLQNFLASLRAEEAEITTGAEAIETLRLVGKLRESIATGAPVAASCTEESPV